MLFCIGNKIFLLSNGLVAVKAKEQLYQVLQWLQAILGKGGLLMVQKNFWFSVILYFIISFLNMRDCFAAENFGILLQDRPLISYPYDLPPHYREQRNMLNFLTTSSGIGMGRDTALTDWIRYNVSSKTGMFLSFQVMFDEKAAVYSSMGAANTSDGIIERMIVDKGIVIYDAAVGQIALTLSGRASDIRLAQLPLNIYWNGKLRNLTNIRAGYLADRFVYDPNNPEAVSSDVDDKGRRGFIFRIINADGDYLGEDPLDGKTRLDGFPTWPDIHWEDWKPVAGENAWVVMAAMHLFHRKYFDQQTRIYEPHLEAVELRLAEELARAALFLQAENGGIRMAPLGTYRENEAEASANMGSWWYNQISTENCLSWYSAFRMLYKVTGKEEYSRAMERLEGYFRHVFDREGHFFYQGMNFKDGQWNVNSENFAVDVQTWGILALGADRIDEWFGDGAAYAAWMKVKDGSTKRDVSGQLLGVGYTMESDRVSVEWSAGAVMAMRRLADFYDLQHSDWSSGLRHDAAEMRAGLEYLRRDLSGGRSAYAYSSRRGWIPFGWNSHDPRVLSLASTGWILFADQGYDPFYIDGSGKKGETMPVLTPPQL